MDQNMWNFNRKMKNHIQQEYWKLIWKISTLWKEYTNKIKYCNRFSCICLAKVHWWSHAPNKSITIMLIGFIYLEWSELIMLASIFNSKEEVLVFNWKLFTIYEVYFLNLLKAGIKIASWSNFVERNSPLKAFSEVKLSRAM